MLLVPDLDADMLRWIDGGLTPETDPERFAAFAALAANAAGLRSAQAVATGCGCPPRQARKGLGQGLGPLRGRKRRL
jgi:hypothetical protein